MASHPPSSPPPRRRRPPASTPRRDRWIAAALVAALTALVALAWWRAGSLDPLEAPAIPPLAQESRDDLAIQEARAHSTPRSGIGYATSTPTPKGQSAPARRMGADERKADAPPSPTPAAILYEEHFADEPNQRTAKEPEPKTSPAPRAAPGEVVPVAVIIDDLGYNEPVSKGIAKLHADITLAILPGGGASREVASLGKSQGKEIILHQPMEPAQYPSMNPGPGALLTGMDSDAIRRVLNANLAQFPEAVGVNNHMGSKLTTNRPAMDSVMQVLAEKGLFFVDSRTAAHSAAFAAAANKGVPRAQRDIFLDNVHDVNAILNQLRLLERVARDRGSAVGIGHPYPETLAALDRWLPGLEGRGIRVVRASRLLAPDSARAKYPAQRLAKR
ncbi:MAG: divergent polysaccharide deacetylase family protein [Magnetococcales bacterium]|nr:divergent polysaccharide deacetylase family protein [Magnetococcales bacterium]